MLRLARIPSCPPFRQLASRSGGSEKDSGIDADALISSLFGSRSNSATASSKASSFKVAGENQIRDIEAPAESKVPRLTNGLDRVLFNPGVHLIKDLRTNVYNFDPGLQKIVQPEDFNFACLPGFIPPSKDSKLQRLANETGAKFVSSTSSISASLGMIYFVVSNMRKLNLANLSSAFAEENKNFTMMTRSPTSVILRPHGDGIRSVVTEKVDSASNILSLLGQSLERRLTMENVEFEAFLKDSGRTPPVVEDLDGYAHTHAGNLLIRSQLDCYDPRLPRKSFDLKTRATLPIRMDIPNYKSHLDYRLTSQYGLFGSFEREFYDMCRSALLKYNFQVRIGNMDGIFVAYHNTAEIFGFQYLSREAMDECLFGNSVTGDASFLLITKLYNEILDLIVPLFKEEETIRLTFLVNKMGSKLTLFAESISEPNLKNELAPNAKQFRQFNLTTVSTINNIRSDDISLHPFGTDIWKLSYSLSEVQPDQSEFSSTRAKVSEIILGSPSSLTSFSQVENSGRSTMHEGFTRNIQKSIASSRHLMPETDDDPIIANWTYPANNE